MPSCPRFVQIFFWIHLIEMNRIRMQVLQLKDRTILKYQPAPLLLGRPFLL